MTEPPTPDTLSPELLRRMNGYWRAANYLSVGHIYLEDNPLLEAPLEREHLTPRLLGHWGTTPWLNFIYVAPGAVRAEATRVLGNFLRDVMSLNRDKQDFRVFGPDETASNRLDAIYEASGKEWMARIEDVDTDLSATGRLAGRQMV